MYTYQYRARINPHNDLITLAHYHVGIVKRKVETGTYEGIRLDGMSAVIAMAFAVEAVVNYTGAKKRDRLEGEGALSGEDQGTGNPPYSAVGNIGDRRSSEE